MDQADSVLSTPPINTPTSTTRRGFLTQGGGAVLALAAPAAAPASALDPVFALITAHREVVATVHAIEAETIRQSDLGIYVETEANDITEHASAEIDLF